jgi:CrcB protein
MSLLLIALAGGLGSLLRYGLAVGLAETFGTALPYGTLMANVLGSFALGVVAETFAGGTIAGTDARLVLGVGLLGGFTTYSSFNLEVIRLFEQAAFLRGFGYLCGTVLGCLAAGVLGLAVGRLMGASPAS